MRRGRITVTSPWLPLLVVVTSQALLLFYRLDLLDAWGDELFTRNAVARGFRGMIPILQGDIHPPLYYFVLRVWAQIPLPWTGIAALRAFSGLMALLCTVLFDRFWLRRWRPAHRWLALALFAFSPCLLLYGRMARSYTMQTALAILTISLLYRWLNRPREILACAAPAFASMVLLLYTHYLPGIAILGAFTLVGWKQLGLLRTAAWTAATIAAYLPWIPTLAGALRAWGQATGFQSHYLLTGSLLFDEAFKVLFALISLTIGESFAPVALLLVPLVLWIASRGIRVRTHGPALAPLLAVAAVAGYIGATRWVTWPFVAARLLWLLPFLTLAVAMGLARSRRLARYGLAALIFLSFGSSAIFYFRRENFANLGYAAPLSQIAGQIRAAASTQDVILADAYDTDADALHFYLGDDLPFVLLGEATAGRARDLAAAPASRAVWIIRNTRDISPGRLVTVFADEACRGRTKSSTKYEPVPAWERGAMRIVTGVAAPEYFYQVIVCR